MIIDKNLECPKCRSKDFEAKYEVTYVYTYKINNKNKGKTLPFLFDNRKQYGSKQYLECSTCKTQYPCQFPLDGEEIDFTIIQKAIPSEHVRKPSYWG